MRLKDLSVPVLAAAICGCAAVRPAVPPLPRAMVTPSSIKAEAIVEAGRSVTLRGKAVIAAKSPASFRIEVLGPFNSTLALIVSDGESLRVVTGNDPPQFGETEPPYPFSAGDIVSFLLGTAPAPQDGQMVSEDPSGHVTRIVRLKDGSPVFTASLSDYREAGGAHIPFNISIEGGGRTLRIRYTSVEINPELDTDFFNSKALH
ncbi:MAG: hypothetical protein HY893_07355 [Deltaproteobacteria bacterium]|nr:hypothetical protein [Deltaproteobacteria bacterium]